MTTFAWCTKHECLYNKELGCKESQENPFVAMREQDCNSAYSADAHKPNQRTIDAMEAAHNI